MYGGGGDRERLSQERCGHQLHGLLLHVPLHLVWCNDSFHLHLPTIQRRPLSLSRNGSRGLKKQFFHLVEHWLQSFLWPFLHLSLMGWITDLCIWLLHLTTAVLILLSISTSQLVLKIVKGTVEIHCVTQVLCLSCYWGRHASIFLNLHAWRKPWVNEEPMLWCVKVVILVLPWLKSCDTEAHEWGWSAVSFQ